MVLGAQVVEWDNAKPGDIVYRYPDDRLRWGSFAIVAENQWAIFYKDGKALDLLPPGRKMFKTMDLPLLGRVIKLFVGDIFQAEVIFVSKSKFDGKFGGRTQTQELAPLMYHGQYWFKVIDPRLFVTEICGNNNIFTTEAVNNYIRGYFNENVMTLLSGHTLRQVYGELKKTSAEVTEELKNAFEKIGLELDDVKFVKIDTEEKYRDRLFYMQTGGVGAGTVLASETQKDVAKEIGKSTGGAGTAFVMTGGLKTEGIATAGGDYMTCVHCGTQNKAGVKFCSNCGKEPVAPPVPKPTGEGGTCKNCGDPLDPGQKFCEKCGAAASVDVCKKCGDPLDPGQKFCEMCGHPVGPLKCYKCGDPLEPGQRFCEKCGTKV
ncbi:MAG: SPFH domain-containing protein [Candidatus Lokiarchaeota archaeon]|nr:SPFH domain-containing protein [Candidatus Lokiarchaeota archaeon]